MSRPPVFLTLEQVLEIHQAQLALFGGADGIRDLGLLEAALAMPQASFGGEFAHEDIPAMAAAYLFHIAKNHPFIDGNKRVGASAALIFLGLNGVVLKLTNDGLVSLTLGIAEGRISKKDAAETFRHGSVRRGKR
ncbi:MAG: type II toxin-antitoxin system death-on-curing family toxin [Planctomycetes bacterium]|nr:type II toxin-antitoxin system death-on-curing family toxin [Planctomycetota bacterium]